MEENTILPDLQAAILCEDVRAEMSGQQTLVGVINAIPAPVLPVGLFKLCLWSRWSGGTGRFEQRSLILAPDEESVVGESRVQFVLQEMNSHATNVHVFGGVKFESYGVHHVEIQLDGELRLRFPFPVIQVRQAGA